MTYLHPSLRRLAFPGRSNGVCLLSVGLPQRSHSPIAIGSRPGAAANPCAKDLVLESRFSNGEPVCWARRGAWWLRWWHVVEAGQIDASARLSLQLPDQAMGTLS